MRVLVVLFSLGFMIGCFTVLPKHNPMDACNAHVDSGTICSVSTIQSDK